MEETYDARKIGYDEALEALRAGEHPTRIVIIAGGFVYIAEAWNRMRFRYLAEYLLPHDCGREQPDAPKNQTRSDARRRTERRHAPRLRAADAGRVEDVEDMSLKNNKRKAAGSRRGRPNAPPRRPAFPWNAVI